MLLRIMRYFSYYIRIKSQSHYFFSPSSAGFFSTGYSTFFSDSSWAFFSFSFLACSFLISFSFCKYFCAIEKILVDNFLVLKLKAPKVYFESYFFPLSKMTSVSSLATSLLSASNSSSVGTNDSSSSWTDFKAICSF